MRSRSRPAAWIAALPAISVTREEYEPRSTGVRSVSAGCTRMSLGSMPSTSATRYARIESDPWPMSVAPQSTATAAAAVGADDHARVRHVVPVDRRARPGHV